MKSARKPSPPESGRLKSAKRRVPTQAAAWSSVNTVAWGACVLGLILLAAAFLWPFSNRGSVAPDSLPLAEAPTRPAPVELPTSVAEATAEQLRDELVKLADDLLKRFPKTPEALHVAALVYADLQKTTEAEKLWRECIPLAPHQAGPYVGLATATMELGRDQEAVEILEQARRAGCSTPDLYSQQAAALTKLGMLDDAQRVARDGLTRFPQIPENWLQLGQIQSQLGHFADAEASLKQSIATGSTSEQVYFSLASACARQGKQEEAAKHRQEFSDRKAARLANTDERFQGRYDSEMRRIAVTSICRAGSVYDQQGDTVQAEARFIRALNLSPGNVVACNELAMLYRRLGRIADAQIAQQRLVILEPHHIPHRINLASLSQQLGDLEKAELELNEVIRLRPDLSIGYSSLARIHLQSGRADQARTLAEEARQRAHEQSDRVTACLVLAAACEQLGDLAAAREAIAQVQQIIPATPGIPSPSTPNVR